MNLHLRMPAELHVAARADLSRPHPFAAERVGFFSMATGRLGADDWLLLVNGYASVPDEHYLDDPWAGARIGPAAIRASLQRILDHGCGQLHVHLHDHKGLPGPSGMDAREMPALIRSMSVAGPACAHGALILSLDGAWAEICAPGRLETAQANQITVVGFPMLFLKR
jgi:hypothetical protein